MSQTLAYTQQSYKFSWVFPVARLIILNVSFQSYGQNTVGPFFPDTVCI